MQFQTFEHSCSKAEDFKIFYLFLWFEHRTPWCRAITDLCLNKLGKGPLAMQEQEGKPSETDSIKLNKLGKGPLAMQEQEGKPSETDSIKFKISSGGGRVERRCWVNFQCQGVLLVWMIVGQGPIALALGAGGVFFWTFFLSSIFSLFFLPLFGRRPDID